MVLRVPLSGPTPTFLGSLGKVNPPVPGRFLEDECFLRECGLFVGIRKKEVEIADHNNKNVTK